MNVGSLASLLLFSLAFDLAAEVKLVARIAMRDGVKLSTNIFLPADASRYPTLLVRTPYNKGTDLLPTYQGFIKQGYAVVIQDVRGRYGSGGVFDPPMQEIADGSDTLNWIARQSWCNGNIGMLGGSYVGITQWKAVISGNRKLKAIFPAVAGHDDYIDRFYSRGGALKPAHRLLWMFENLRAPFHRSRFETFVEHRPLRTADLAATGRTVPFWQATMNHPTYDSYWKARSIRQKIDRLNVPSFVLSGWFDNFAQSDLELFSELRSRSPNHYIVVGPWGHSMSVPLPGVSFGADSGIPVRFLQSEWFDQWLRGKTPQEFKHPPVRLFVMGINRWREEQSWPLQRARPEPYYLASSKGAATLTGDGTLIPQPRRRDAKDEFTYDPAHPVPTRGGSVCCNPKILPWGPLDQRDVEARPDVLVFTSAPLKENLEVTGVVRAVLYVSTTARDTDFTVKLIDVFPDGHARLLTDGILRLRYRESLERPVLAQPGQIYAITIDVGVTSNVFLAGHKIRVDISSSNFPRFDRNPNTGTAVADEYRSLAARQTVYHGRTYPSHILLPVVPDSAPR